MFKKNKKPVFASVDFEESFLPHDRKGQFKFILKTRKSLFLLLGLIITAFALPLLIALLFSDYAISNAYSMFQNGELAENDFYAFFYTNGMVFGLICSALFVVFSVGLSGVMGVLKKLIYGQPVFLKHDFKNGIKSNIRSFLSISFAVAVITSLISVLFGFVGPTFWYLVFAIIFLVFVLPMMMGMYFYKATYDANVSLTVKNSVQLFIITNIKSIGLTLLLVLVPVTSNVLAALLIITPMINEFICVAYGIFFLPWILLGMYAFYYSVFDKKINKTNFKSFYMKGLYHLEKVEEESNENQI